MLVTTDPISVVFGAGSENSDGQVHVQHFGAAHEVPGSDQYFDVPAGCSITIRHPHGAVRILHIGDRA